MSIVLTAVGLTIIAVILLDVFITILSASRAGPLTRGWSRPVWELFLVAHRRRPIHGVLSLVGPMMVVVAILLWYGGLVLGTWLVFVAHPGSVVSNGTRLGADTSQTLYFVPTTLSGLGYGDYVPGRFPWTMFATSMSLIGTLVVTVSLSYILSVLSAAIARRAMASDIRGLGADPVTFIQRAALGDPVRSMHTYLQGMASAISDAAERQRAYPVLRYFHSARVETSAAPSVLVVADATFLLRTGAHADGCGDGLLTVLEAAIDGFIEAKTTPDEYVSAALSGPLREYASRLDIETSDDSTFNNELPAYLQRRAALISACHDDGWSP